MQRTRRKWTRVLIGAALFIVLFYPVVGNVLLLSGALESIISRKPEKLLVQWDNAWTLIPGKVNVEGFSLDIHTRKHRIQVDADVAEVDLSLVSLLDKTVDIRSAVTHGVEFSYQKRTPPEGATDAQIGSATTQAQAGADVKETQSQPEATKAGPSPTKSKTEGAAKKPKKKPWIIDLKDISATGVRTVQFLGLNLVGSGELRNLALRIVTKGGPLRIDDIDVGIEALTSPELPPDHPDQKSAQVDAQIRLAENIPKQNKGRKLFKFLSTRLQVTGSANSIEFLSALLGNKYQINVSGGGELDMLVIVESGELMDGSKVKVNSEQFDVDFLNLHASGLGTIDAGIDGSRVDPVRMNIGVEDFKLNRHGITNPYMEGADLILELAAKRIFLDREMEDPKLFVHFPDSNIRELTDYNRFIPEQAHVRILDGAGRLRGTMQLEGDTGHINMELTGSDVMLEVEGNRITSDLRLVANLADGNYGEKSYDLTGTYFRMEDTQLVRDGNKTKSDWWGEVKVKKGDLVFSEPMDIDGEMSIKMRDTEPLLTLLREEGKKKGLLEKALTVKDLEGTIGIQTTENNLTLDPILINGEGLEIISTLDLMEDSMDGALYFKLHGIAVNFDISDNKVRFKGFGGKKKVKQRLRHSSPHEG